MNHGEKIAHYTVTAKIGAGGMGEVYRATDGKLGREVALKVLPEAFAQDAQRMQRFQREAQVLASLNHPNIAAIYGLERQDKIQALVMELVEGPTLAERIAQGAVPLEETLPIARQIAEALEYAHEKGVVHRDLKPANIKLTPDNQVKVLDFGLAKALQQEDSAASVSADFSPTLSLAATKAGIILGTAAYMAPEQARGKQVDRRADVWSFGVVLYEMLSGQRAFSGEDISVTLANVIKDDPAWEHLPPQLPAQVSRLLRRCLTKDPRNRLRDIGEARIAIEEAIANPAAAAEAAATAGALAARPFWKRALPWVAASFFALLALAALTVLRPAPAGPPLRKFDLAVENLWVEETRIPRLSADGRRLLYAKAGEIWIRQMDSLVPRVLPDTYGGELPAWSPDGAEIAFVREGRLWKTPAGGGQPAAIASLPAGVCNAGLVWGEDRRIYYSPGCQGNGLFAVSAQGGEFKEVLPVEKGEYDYHEISLLPEGRGVLLVLDRQAGATDALVAFDGAQRKTLLQVAGAQFANVLYSPTGHVLYERRDDTPGLWAAPFSLSRLEITGESFLVAAGAARASLAADGTLAFLSAIEEHKAQVTWLSRAGEVVGQVGEGLQRARHVRLSLDGKHAAVTAIPERGDEQDELFLVDLARGTQTRLTFSDIHVGSLSWGPASDTIYYEAGQTVFSKATDGTGGPKKIVERALHPDVSRDGKFLLFTRIGEGASSLDIWYLPLGEGGEPHPLVEDPEVQRGPNISPDGRYVAYTSRENGSTQVFVKPFPGGEGKWQVSPGRGSEPRWNRRGDKLFYAADNQILMEVDVDTRASLRLGQPRQVFQFHRFAGSLLWRGYDVEGNGERFVTAGTATGLERTTTITIVQNWFAEFQDKAKP